MSRDGAVEVLVTRLDPDLDLPAYEHPGDAGLDLRARHDVDLSPGARMLMPTGIAIAMPAGYAGFVHARSGQALRRGLAVANGTGVVDAGYRGEIGVVLVNLDPVETVHIVRGERIAQLVVAPVAGASLIEVAHLPGSHRGEGGFGSSGAR